MLKVFLIDDEYFERTSLKNNIPWTENGFEVIGEANNGKSAFQLITELRPDIAIVDINIPSYNGLELIERLQQKQIPCCYIILTGYEEFAYAQKAVQLDVYDYILKPINYEVFLQTLIRLKKKLQEQHTISDRLISLQQENDRLLLEHYYNDLLNCNTTTYQLCQYAPSLAAKMKFDCSAYAVAVFDFYDKPGIPALRKIQAEAETLFASLYLVCSLDNQKRIFFIMDASDHSRLCSAIHSIYQFLKKNNPGIAGGIGRTYCNFNQLYLSYNEACIALQNHSLMKKDLIFYQDIPSNPAVPELDVKMKNQLKTLILDKEIDRIKHLLSDLYTNQTFQNVTYDGVILLTMELLNLLTEVLSGQVSTPISVLSIDSNILDTLRNMNDIKKLQSWIVSIYETSIERVTSHQSDYTDTTICIEKYIREHLSDPELSISQIASALYLNYSYICFRFKQDKDMTINDFINKCRIEKAIDMFQNHIDNIGYVAEKTGFSNAGYFSKKFKKATGLSPSDYIHTLN